MDQHNPDFQMTRIMIVDDNAVFAMELEEAARELGYRITGVASTGLEAVQMAKWMAFRPQE